MTSRHLDHQTYAALKAGTLDRDAARALGLHLAEDCEICEAFLAGLPPDELDARLDGLLAGLPSITLGASGSEAEFARIQAALRPRRTPVARLGRWIAAGMAVLMVGGVSLLVTRSRPGEQGEPVGGVKGAAARPIPARLRFAVIEAGGGKVQLDRGESGAVVPSGASLAFRVELGRPAYLTLVRIGSSGESEVVWREHAARAGTVDVSERGRPAAYPLQGLEGRQRFAMVASERPPTPEDLVAAERAATGAGAFSGDPRWSLMTLDVVEILVH